MIHAFAGCELDDELFELRRRGRLVKVEPKAFDVLAYLLRHRQRVVTKDELLDAVWQRVAVSESVLPKCIAALRRAVGDTRARPRVIQTVHGRGYRFVAAVETRRGAEDTAAADGAAVHEVQAGLPFVGRERLLERLHAALDAAIAGHGRLVLLAGEPGVGKTRTAEQVAGEGRRRGALVVSGRGQEGEGAPAFWPWIQVLRACARHPELRTSFVDIGASVPEIAALVPEPYAQARPVAIGGADAGAPRFRLFDGVTLFLKRAAECRPLVVTLDDLHWADEGSLRLLRFLAGELSDSRLLLLATCRDEDRGAESPLAELLGALARESGCESVPLLGLDPEESAALVDRVVGRPIARELSAAIHGLTDGNPFFIQEMARLLAHEPARADAGAEALARALPRRVRDAIIRRLGTLTVECCACLRVASVLGREFDAALLARVAEVPHDRILDLLTEARTAGVLDGLANEPGRYAFHHVLIRHALYEGLGDAERSRWHRRAGERLEEMRGSDIDASADELAYHFGEAAPGGDAERAVIACVRAAERAYRLLGYEQSARQYERALRALDLQTEPVDPRRAELLLALGEARAAAGARPGALDAFERAAVIARQLRRADVLARAALGYRGPSEMGMPAQGSASALLEEALAAVGDAHPPLRARLLSRLAGMPPLANAMETRDQLSQEALVLAHAAGDGPALRDALSARLWACVGPDRIDARLAVAEELLALAARERSASMALLAYDAQLGARLLRGEMEAADRALAAYTRVAEELRQPALIFQATFWRGSQALARGELAAAEALFRGALERGRGTVPYAHFMFAGQMYPLIYMRGDTEQPELSGTFFGEMMDLPYSWEPAVRSAFAFALLIRGERDAARGQFERLAEPGFESLRRDEHWLVTLTGLSSLAAILEDGPRAARLYELLAPYAELVVVHDLLRSTNGTVAVALAHLATTLGRYDEGAEFYERAIAKETAMGAFPATCISTAGYARLLRRRNQHGDRTRAQTLERETRARMAALGIRRNWLLDLLT